MDSYFRIENNIVVWDRNIILKMIKLSNENMPLCNWIERKGSYISLLGWTRAELCGNIHELYQNITGKEYIINNYKIYDYTFNVKENSLAEINNGVRIDCVAYLTYIDEPTIHTFFRKTLTIDKFCSIPLRPENRPICWHCERCGNPNYRTATCLICTEYAIGIMKSNYIELYFIDFDNKDIQYLIKSLFCYVVVDKFYNV